MASLSGRGLKGGEVDGVRVRGGMRLILEPSEAFQGIEHGLIKVSRIISAHDDVVTPELRYEFTCNLEDISDMPDIKEQIKDIEHGTWAEYSYIDSPAELLYLPMQVLLDHASRPNAQ
jgi:hypothetical protein